MDSREVNDGVGMKERKVIDEKVPAVWVFLRDIAAKLLKHY